MTRNYEAIVGIRSTLTGETAFTLHLGISQAPSPLMAMTAAAATAVGYCDDAGHEDVELASVEISPLPQGAPIPEPSLN